MRHPDVAALIPGTVLVLLSVALANAVYHSGGLTPTPWNLSLALVALAAAIHTQDSGILQPAPLGNAGWVLLILPLYVLVQTIPAPPGLVQLLSPQRADLFFAAQAHLVGESLIPLSVKPAATWSHALRLGACVLTFLVTRRVAAARPNQAWLLAAPIVMIAAAESVWGLNQARGPLFWNVAQGSYLNRNHLAGFLELALPFPILFAAWSIRGKRAIAQWRFWLAAAIAVLLFMALLHTQSRMGLIAAVASGGALGALMLYRRLKDRRTAWRSRPRIVVVLLLAVLVCYWLIPPALVRRFRGLAAGDVSLTLRLRLWKESLPLIRDYPLAGCGLGAYASALYPYQDASLDFADHAHNDYLQTMIELGPIIWSFSLLGLGAILLRSVRLVSESSIADLPYAGIAALAGVLALLLHSLADFNLYIPANALAFAWIAGIAVGLTFGTSQNPSRGRNIAIPLGSIALAVGAALALWRSESPPPAPQSPEDFVGQARHALAGDSGSPYIWCDLGDALYAALHQDEARRCFERAVQLAPHLPEVARRASRLGADTHSIVP